ncbi:MAG: leucine--tRNA ligase [Candidatus Falkowbacteria bacterium]|nr:leucine--tRNA ligase [Candidatus Falkowbacteria bacterium]
MYDHKKIEKKWQEKWEVDGVNKVDLDNAKKPFYNLMMFPYPSAEGLHVGNMYAFVHSDAYGRFMRLQGYNVFEPIGLDGFGIHAENYAIKIGEHIRDVSVRTEANYYRQLRMIGNQYDWSHKIETYKDNYYKWTQWLFLQMYKKGLAYRKKSLVSWCPKCKTGLADEQIIGGKCERCDTETEKKEMKQWFFKITEYAEKLDANLANIDWSEEVRVAQKNWIGRKDGAQIEFEVLNSASKKEQHKAIDKIAVFTTRPDTLFGVTFLAVCPEHQLIEKNKLVIKNLKKVEDYIDKIKNKSDIDRTDLNADKSGIELKGLVVINPVNQKQIPIFVVDYILPNYGTGAIMAVPAHDARDFAFAKKYKLEIVEVVSKNNEKNKGDLEQAFEGEGVNVDSDFLNGQKTSEAKEKMLAWLESNNLGTRKINYRLRDWCVSRQRYWGPPIPMIKCEDCDWVPVPEDQLPVKLPPMDDYLPDGTGKGPLNKIKDFVDTECPKCGKNAERETDVSDPFVDSSWYFLRFLSTEFERKALDKERLAKWMPVSMYIGGKEHSVLHLLYARFVTMVLHESGYVPQEEPFLKFRAHGLVIKDGAKMSKSKGNVVNPDDYIKAYGADTVRMYLMFLSDMRQGGDWRDDGVKGMNKFINKIYLLIEKVGPIDQVAERGESDDFKRLLHKTIRDVKREMESLKYNTAISKLMILVNKMQEVNYTRDEFGDFAILLAAFAPHLAEEIWEKLKLSKRKSIFEEIWPEYDEALTVDKILELVIQINGKVRAKEDVMPDITENEARAVAMDNAKIKEMITGKKIKKIIFVPGRLVNIVIE